MREFLVKALLVGVLRRCMLLALAHVAPHVLKSANVADKFRIFGTYEIIGVQVVVKNTHTSVLNYD